MQPVPASTVAASLAVFLVAAMSFAHIVQRATRNAGWVDAIWSAATGIGAASATVASAPHAARAWWVGAAALLWSGRLAAHIAERSASGPEDVRYARFRREWGAGFEAKLFGLLMIQGACAFVLAGSVCVAGAARAAFPALSDVVGLVILLAAIGGEAVADRQMRAFRRAHRGRNSVCDIGLWGRSRHPNYLFEWLGWLAYPVIAIGAAPAHWASYVALSGPLLIYLLLVHVSGIPPLEREMIESRGDAYAAYQARVPAFFPSWRTQ